MYKISATNCLSGDPSRTFDTAGAAVEYGARISRQCNIIRTSEAPIAICEVYEGRVTFRRGSLGIVATDAEIESIRSVCDQHTGRRGAYYVARGCYSR